MCLINNPNFWFQLRWSKSIPPSHSHWTPLKSIDRETPCIIWWLKSNWAPVDWDKKPKLKMPWNQQRVFLFPSSGISWTELKGSPNPELCTRCTQEELQKKTSFFGAKNQEREPLKVKRNRGNTLILFVSSVLSCFTPKQIGSSGNDNSSQIGKPFLWPEELQSQEQRALSPLFYFLSLSPYHLILREM